MQRFLDLFTYLLTPWSRVLLGKLTVNFAASEEIARIYGTRKSLTVPTSVRHLSLFWANSIQSPRPLPTSWRSILILPSHLRLGLPFLDLFISINFSACFRRFLRPSSGAQNCTYSVSSWWWAKEPPETCRAIYRNKYIEKTLHLVGCTSEITDFSLVKKYHEHDFPFLRFITMQ
jgi:hypothetical protein